MEIHGNQATPKYLGYVYQVLVAIQECLDANKNQTIWIECYGDVYNGTDGIEVKHHEGEHFLIDNSKDFWNTLKNWTTEDISEIKQLILHTTSQIRENSIFDGWNQLSKTKRYDKVKSHTPSDTIKPLYDQILQNKRKDLLPILDKITIRHSQKSVKELWEELVDDRMLVGHIPEQYRKIAFDWIYGYVNRRALIDSRRWNIKVNDFDRDRQIALQRFTQNLLPFQKTSEDEVNVEKRDFHFVNEMLTIELPERPIQRAVSDYLRAAQSQLKMVSLEPATFPDILDEYDETVLEELERVKDKHLSRIVHNDSINTNNESRELYFEALEIPFSAIPSTDVTPQYYKRGRVHFNVEKRDFSWFLTESEDN